MRFAHDRNNSDSRCCSNWFGFEVWPEFGAILNGQGLQNVGHFGDTHQIEFAGCETLAFGKV